MACAAARARTRDGSAPHSCAGSCLPAARRPPNGQIRHEGAPHAAPTRRRGGRPGEDLREGHSGGPRAARDHLPRRSRHGLRTARPERGRQVHDRADPRDAGRARFRARDGRRSGRAPRPGRGAPDPRVRLPAARFRPRGHRPGEPGAAGAPAVRTRGAGPPPRAGTPAALRPARRGRPAVPHLVRGHAAQAGRRHGAGAQPARAVPRRTHDRAGPAGPPRAVGRDHPAGPARGGERAAHHPLPRGGRPARGPPADHRRRPHRRPGHPRGTESGPGQRHRPPRAGRPGRRRTGPRRARRAARRQRRARRRHGGQRAGGRRRRRPAGRPGGPGTGGRPRRLGRRGPALAGRRLPAPRRSPVPGNGARRPLRRCLRRGGRCAGCRASRPS